MASPLKRPAIYLNLAGFVGVSVFCISTDAPIIQQDVLRRCQDTLLIHRIPIRGLEVEGRDVTLSGPPESPIISPGAQAAIKGVAGVRVVKTRASSNSDSTVVGAQIGAFDSSATGRSSNSAQEVQDKIDRVLENQDIGFRSGTTVLTLESELELDRIATYLSEAPSLLCEIRGYDSQPPEVRQEWVLALQRALATEDYLEKKGIADWRLSAHTFHIGEGTAGRRTDRNVDLLVRTRE